MKRNENKLHLLYLLSLSLILYSMLALLLVDKLYAEIYSKEINLKKGWNLISLPLSPDDNYLFSLFPDAEVAYEFKGGTYINVESLEVGKGYWVKMDTDHSYKIIGTPFSSCLQGSKGEKGDQGLPPAHQWIDSFLRFQNPNGSWGNSINLKGPTGIPGKAPQHEWKGTSIRFKNPDGAWGNFIDLKGSPGVIGLSKTDNTIICNTKLEVLGDLNVSGKITQNGIYSYAGQIILPVKFEGIVTDWTKVNMKTSFGISWGNYDCYLKGDQKLYTRVCMTYTDGSKIGRLNEIKLRIRKENNDVPLYEYSFLNSGSDSRLIHHSCGDWVEAKNISCYYGWGSSCFIEVDHINDENIWIDHLYMDIATK